MRKAILALAGIAVLGLLAWGGAAKPETTLSCPAPGLYTAAEAGRMMAAKCYLVGISVLTRVCGCADLYVLRYLCYDPYKGWYYQKFWYCGQAAAGNPLDPGGGGTGKYSYPGGSNCGSATFVDPVSVVFYGGTYQTVQQHACDHGGWCHNSGGPQRFWTYGCYDQDANANSSSLSLGQYHMRILTARNWEGGYACDAKLGHYNVATPHHEDWLAPQLGCGSSMHSVYDNLDYPPGGFVQAREEIMRNWVDEGPHLWRGRYWWGNNQHFKQSAGKGLLNGCWWAWSDGYVDYISLSHR